MLRAGSRTAAINSRQNGPSSPIRWRIPRAAPRARDVPGQRFRRAAGTILPFVRDCLARVAAQVKSARDLVQQHAGLAELGPRRDQRGPSSALKHGAAPACAPLSKA